MVLVIDSSRKEAYVAVRGTDFSLGNILKAGVRDAAANDLLIAIGLTPNR
jgi:hypothetical protein